MSLKPSQIAALRIINERPTSIHAIGADYARDLEAAGFITIKGATCRPTAAAAPYAGRTAGEQRRDREAARATLIGRWGTSFYR